MNYPKLTRKSSILQSLSYVLLPAGLIMIAAGCGGGQNAMTSPTPTPTPVISNTVAVTFLAPMPVAVAEQIGAGNWTSASLPGSGVLTVGLPSGTTRYGIAFLCTRTASGSPVNNEWIIEADLRDGSAYSLQMCNPNSPVTPTTGNISGSVDATAISGTFSLDIFLQGSGAIFENATTASFNTTVPTGTADLYAVAYDNTATILAMKILRSQTVPGTANGGNTITLTASDAVTLQPISVVNAPSGGFSAPQTNPPPAYVSAHGGFQVGIGFVDSTKYAVVSAADAQSGDYYTFNATSGTASQIVSTQQFQTTNGPVTLTLPAPWSPVSPAPAAFPTFTFDYTGFSGQAVVVDSAGILWGAGFNAIGIYSTANHQNGATALSIPDLTSIPGFSAIVPSGTINWGATTWGGTTQPYLNSVAPPIPQTLSSVVGLGSYTIP
jgi:hypothetical protein